MSMSSLPEIRLRPLKAGSLACQQCGLSIERPTRTVKNPTPFPEYFGQNVCVEPATARHVADFLLDARKEEEEMASDIRTMEASLAQMKAEHIAAKLFIAKHEALLSRVHRLPNEILEQIFLLIPGANDLSAIPPTSQDDLDRWHLTWVCQQWRTVAIQATGLWNAMNIWDGSYYPDDISPLLELSLSRTRGLLPLLLDISTNQTDATYALILKYSAHIQFLRYRIYIGETRIPEDPDAHFESLEDLTVFIDTDREVVDSDNCSISSEDRCTQVELDLDKYLSPFRLCVSLETFDLRIDTHSQEYRRKYSSYVSVHPERMTFPWKNLSVFELHIEDRCLFPLDSVLAACKMLQNLNVDGYKGTSRRTHTSLLLPELSTIRLKNISRVDLLPAFNIPALQTLSLEEVGCDLERVSSLFCLSHPLSTLRLPPCNEWILRKWRGVLASMGQPLDCFDLRVSPYLDDPVSSNPSVLPLAREVRLGFPGHIDGRFVEVIHWVQEDNNYLESLTLVFEEWEPSDVGFSWWKENRGCRDYPTKDEMLEWAEDKLRRSDFMARVNSIACAGVNVKMIMKGNDGSETRVEDDYLRDQIY